MAEDKQPDKPERQKMEMGGSGVAEVSFADAFGGDVKIKSVVWTATGAVAVTPDADDPTTANIFASGPGPVTLTAVGTTETGASATAITEIMVIEKDAPVTGEIEVTVKAAPAKPKAPEPKAPEPPVRGQPAHR
jgi:hypothetical protein